MPRSTARTGGAADTWLASHARAGTFEDDSLAAAADLPEPDAIADEIVADLESALEQFRATAEELK
jgi:hypothetical protein